MDLLTRGNLARWIARTLGLLYFAFIALFVVAHALSQDGLPSLWKLSLGQRLDTLALLLVVIGGVVGWRWEGAATLMILFGTALWLLMERHLPWPPGLSVLTGVFYGIAWSCANRTMSPQQTPS